MPSDELGKKLAEFLLADEAENDAILRENRAPTSPDIPSCDGCGAEFAGTLQCGRCESAFYCGRECQVRAWKQGGHKKACATLQQDCQAAAAEVLVYCADADAEHNNNARWQQVWESLDGSGAYKAAVQQGLYPALLELFKSDRDNIIQRFREGRTLYSHTQNIMCVLFRGQRVEGRGPYVHSFGCMDGGRIKAFLRNSDPDQKAWEVWMDASIQILKLPLDAGVARNREVHGVAHKAARDVWAGWVMLLTNSAAAKALLLPSSNKESAEDSAVDHDANNVARAKALGDKMKRAIQFKCGIKDATLDPGGVVEGNLNTAAAMMDCRYREYDSKIDFASFLNLKGQPKYMFQQVAMPMARATIEKGGNLTAEEFRHAVATQAARKK